MDGHRLAKMRCVPDLYRTATSVYAAALLRHGVAEAVLCCAEDMQQDAIDCAAQAMEKYNPTWHCIVGRNFGSYVTHETKHFIYFYLGQVAILLFKSG